MTTSFRNRLKCIFSRKARFARDLEAARDNISHTEENMAKLDAIVANLEQQLASDETQSNFPEIKERHAFLVEQRELLRKSLGEMTSMIDRAEAREKELQQER